MRYRIKLPTMLVQALLLGGVFYLNSQHRTYLANQAHRLVRWEEYGWPFAFALKYESEQAYIFGALQAVYDFGCAAGLLVGCYLICEAFLKNLMNRKRWMSMTAAVLIAFAVWFAAGAWFGRKETVAYREVARCDGFYFADTGAARELERQEIEFMVDRDYVWVPESQVEPALSRLKEILSSRTYTRDNFHSHLVRIGENPDTKPLLVIETGK